MISEKLRLLLLIFSLVTKPFDLLKLWLRIGGSKIIKISKVKAYLRNNGIDYWIFLENLIDDTYNLNCLRFFNFDNIVDIGGNIGLFTLSTKKYWPKAKKQIFEPSKKSYAILKKNLKLNHINAVIRNRAVIGDNTPKHVRLYLNENPAMSSLTNKNGLSVTVKTISLAKIIPKNGNTLVKIDIEGGEYALLTSKNKPVFSQIAVLLMETHDIDKSKNASFVVSYLRSIGFKVTYENRQIIAINKFKVCF